MGSVTPKWFSKDTVAVVTGSYKGIGLQIVKDLAKNGITVVLTSRDVGRGEKAAAGLKAEGFETVVFYPGSLEVTSPESLDKLAAWLKNEFGGLDILINNAGVYVGEISYKGAKDSIDVNYYSAKTVTSKLLPLLRPGGRIINIGTCLGVLSYWNESLAKKLGDIDDLTEELIDSYATKYLEDVKAGRWKEEGWSLENPQYTDSKILLHAYTRFLAKKLASTNQKIYVNVIHPGYIATDMTESMPDAGKSTVEDGADTPVWLALLPAEDYPNGKFFSKRKERDYWTKFFE